MLMFFFFLGLVSILISLSLEINGVMNIFPPQETYLTKTLGKYQNKDLLIIVGHAVISVIGGVLITSGYQVGRTSVVAIFEYTFLFFATSWAYLFFYEELTNQILFGLFLIVVSGCIISSKKFIKFRSDSWIGRIRTEVLEIIKILRIAIDFLGMDLILYSYVRNSWQWFKSWELKWLCN